MGLVDGASDHEEGRTDRPGGVPAAGGTDDVLISDVERQHVVGLLRTSVGEGRITLDEFADRVGDVWAARTRADLQAATRQLPVPAPLPSMPAVPEQTTGSVAPRRFTRWTVAIMGGHERKGRWRVRGTTNAFAMMGGCKLDLRNAEVEGPELVITAITIMGGIEVVVPEGIPVDLTGFAFMGGKDCRIADVPVIPGAPIVRVRGFAVMGGINVRSRKAPSKEAEERERRRQERAERRLERNRDLETGQTSKQARKLAEQARLQAQQAAEQAMVQAQQFGQRYAPPPAPNAGAGLPGAARAPGIPVAPDGTVTILFSDIEGFTAMTQRLGDIRAREVLARHNEIVRNHVASCGGYEVKSQGDGFMVAFAGAAKALRCAIGIQRALEEDGREHPDSPVRVRIGLHTGEALRVDDDFHGNAVNMASRIAGAASGGEVLVSSLLRELTDGTGEFAFDGPRHVELKGFDGARTVYPLRWAEQPAQ